jgi:hypothetical protein
MQPKTGNPIQFMNLATPESFDTVTAEDIEQCRRDLGLTPLEFAEYLGWSVRKYQRSLESAREDGFAARDTSLAIRGLVHVLLGADENALTAGLADEAPAGWEDTNKPDFLNGRTFPSIIRDIQNECGEWTSNVLPHLFKLVADRAKRKKFITYGEAATILEDRGKTHRVWPRTLYGLPLGAMCNAVLSLGHEADMRIPLLSSIVISAGGEPGPGLDVMIKRFVKQYETASTAAEIVTRIKRDRAALMKEIQAEVFAFDNWPGVLTALCIE